MGVDSLKLLGCVTGLLGSIKLATFVPFTDFRDFLIAGGAFGSLGFLGLLCLGGASRSAGFFGFRPGFFLAGFSIVLEGNMDWGGLTVIERSSCVDSSSLRGGEDRPLAEEVGEVPLSASRNPSMMKPDVDVWLVIWRKSRLGESPTLEWILKFRESSTSERRLKSCFCSSIDSLCPGCVGRQTSYPKL